MLGGYLKFIILYLSISLESIFIIFFVICYNITSLISFLMNYKAYGVHMNGFVEKDGQKYLWIGKRNDSKPTYPGMLDHLVAGGLVCKNLDTIFFLVLSYKLLLAS